MVFHPCYYCLNSGTPSPTPYATTPEPPTCLLPQGLSLPMLPRLCPTDLSNHQIYTHRFSAYRSFTSPHCSKGKKKKKSSSLALPEALEICLLPPLHFIPFPSQTHLQRRTRSFRACCTFGRLTFLAWQRLFPLPISPPTCPCSGRLPLPLSWFRGCDWRGCASSFFA